MTLEKLKKLTVPFIFLLSVAFSCHTAYAGLSTDKDKYRYGETINVTFSGATGLDGDWICIAPEGSPVTEAGNYRYMPKGMTSGTLRFDSPAPGRYEVRVFYNYNKVGYVAAERAAFSVTGDDSYAKNMEQRMERRINNENPLEAAVPADKGLVYIFREPWGMSSYVDVEVIRNSKPVVILANSDYYPFVVNPGVSQFETGTLFDAGTKSPVAAGLKGKATLIVKPGHVYYLRLKVISLVYYDNYLDNVAHYEGADMIRTYNLNMHK